MSWSLIGPRGTRKYLTPKERAAFIRASMEAEPIRGTFCLALVFSGARISEVLALTVDRIDSGENTIILETLKRRRKGIFRAVPIPSALVAHLNKIHGQSRGSGLSDQKIWKFSRPTAWKYVKQIMQTAKVPSSVATPRALRHAFGVEAVQKHIALSLLKKWLGHAKLETTAIYTDPVGEEERALARRMWPKHMTFDDL